jgi:hypothetical protein
MASQKTFREFLDICEARVPVTRQSGKKLRYKGGEPLPPAHKRSLEAVAKMNRGIYPDPKPEPKPESSEQQTPPRRNRFQFVDRSNSSTQGNTRRGRGGSRFEEVENFEEGIGMTMASALGHPPLLSRRMKLKQALIQREIEKDTEKNKRRRFSGKAADPEANVRRGPRAKRES